MRCVLCLGAILWSTDWFWLQEEDFVTNTYNRPLLDQIQVQDIRTVLEGARTTLSGLDGKVAQDVVEALDLRLQLRSIWLDAVDLSQYRDSPDVIKLAWQTGLGLLSKLKLTHTLGTPVADAFSEKLQRKLASTMPPRPIVQLDFEKAFGHLTRFFTHGIEILDVLTYNDPQSLQVCLMNGLDQQPFGTDSG